MESLHASVGESAVNQKTDVRKIQRLLNRFRRHDERLLKVDGFAGPRTVSAIRDFQHARVRAIHADGRVDVNGPTLRTLSEHPGLRGPVYPHHIAPQPPPQGRPTPAAKPASSLPAPAPGSAPHPSPGAIAWGAKVSSAFKAKTIAISERLQVSPDFLMSCMAFESAETFSPLIRNAAGSGAVGLIQFMPSTAKALKTSSDELRGMSPEQQLDYVEAYFRPYAGRLYSIQDIYMTILYPKAIGKGPDYILFKSGTVAYSQNKGLDRDQDGSVTVREAAEAVRAKYRKGTGVGYLG